MVLVKRLDLQIVSFNLRISTNLADVVDTLGDVAITDAKLKKIQLVAGSWNLVAFIMQK